MSVIQLVESVGLYKGALDFLCKIGLLIIIFLAPIQSLLLTVFALIILDVITGLLAALKKRQKITSAKLSRTVTKTLVYLFTIVIVRVVNEHLAPGMEDIPLTSMVSSFIILTELQSVLENVNKISRQNFLKAIINRLSLVTKGRHIR